MPPVMKWGVWSAGVVGLVLAVIFGPVFAAYVFAAAAFAVIAALMGQDVAQAISDWRLDHPWTLHRTHAPRP